MTETLATMFWRWIEAHPERDSQLVSLDWSSRR